MLENSIFIDFSFRNINAQKSKIDFVFVDIQFSTRWWLLETELCRIVSCTNDRACDIWIETFLWSFFYKNIWICFQKNVKRSKKTRI
jgi:hypothetical protein